MNFEVIPWRRRPGGSGVVGSTVALIAMALAVSRARLAVRYTPYRRRLCQETIIDDKGIKQARICYTPGSKTSGFTSCCDKQAVVGRQGVA